MNTQQASIRTESGTTVRTTRGRRRPVYQTGPALVTCPACGWTDVAGPCARCAAIAKQAAREMTTTCPHCATVQPLAGLVANGCRSCRQMPNRPGRSYPLSN